jgi:hypothetical protein
MTCPIIDIIILGPFLSVPEIHKRRVVEADVAANWKAVPYFKKRSEWAEVDANIAFFQT